ncbi:ubiquinone/menaquinone biosynthesis C-methylase UbiE [Paenibacillus phyllosphaerae]|uniref:Ubiquinone/menaquinone biosynthesis C-methylase UbiE n=1 Tax=Paenibacillus phyllosphaerae TaxID=274593 RepID=A0A7W5AX70_9BACL|nr:methyltransferase domain-containing protein [Paenibacillus phyllosphaerae]MBB3110393.1 ubiquinone/menaquinone biosynthesis C-methylase UbiE [Paenibacillus phyllosphaerae]
MERLLDKELLDDEHAVDDTELMNSLREVWQVNRYLGGNPALFRHLKQMITAIERDRAIRLLDVATGLADIPVALAHWADKRSITLDITGVDIHPRITELAANRTAQTGRIRIEQGDGRRLAFDDGAFDIGFSNLALHHLDEEDAILMIRELSRVCRTGWVVADLERHPAAYAAARLLARFVWRSPVTRHDGPLSVRRSYTAPELRELLRRAGVQGNVYRHFPYRLAVVGHG